MLVIVVDQEKYNPETVMDSRSSYVQWMIQCDLATQPNRQSPTAYFAMLRRMRLNLLLRCYQATSIYRYYDAALSNSPR